MINLNILFNIENKIKIFKFFITNRNIWKILLIIRMIIKWQKIRHIK